MPRSLTRPQVGTVVWYFAAAPPVAGPLVAQVMAAVTTAGTGVFSPPPTFDLAVMAAADAVVTKVAAVPFHYGTRPTTGAWCTMPRVNTPLAGVWPSSFSEGGLDYELHGLTLEQREARAQAQLAKAQETQAGQQAAA